METTLLVPILVLGAAAPSLAMPDTRRPGSRRYVHEAWSTKEGLPQVSVNAIIQSRDGYLWLGTFDGLVRFDGVAFTVFQPWNANGMKTSRIHSLYEGRESLWIGTEGGGLMRLRGGAFTTYAAKGSQATSVKPILEGSDGSLWIQTTAGLTRFKDGRYVTYAVRDGLPSANVVAVCMDREGAVWLGTPRGLARFKDERFTIYGEKHGLPSEDVRALAVDRDGILWAGTRRGLARFEDGVFRPFTAEGGFFERPITALHGDRSGTLWIGTSGAELIGSRGGVLTVLSSKEWLEGMVDRSIQEGQDGTIWIRTERGLSRVKGGALSGYLTWAALPSKQNPVLCIDREGNVWVGTTRGLHKFKPASVTVFSQDAGLLDDEVTSVLESRDGSVWVGTASGGLGRLKDERFEIYTERKGLLDRSVWSLCEDREGNLWVGSASGLYRLKGDRLIRYAAENGPSSTAILSLYADRKGDLWVGTRAKGLFLLRQGRLVTSYSVKDGLSNDAVRAIHEDRAGAMWFATDGGVTRLKGGRFTVWTMRDGLSSDFVRAIHEDDEGTLWFGTYDNGLNRFKDGQFVRYTKGDGLFDHTVSRILDDGRGNFWMTGNRGIYRVARKEMKDFARGTVRSITCVPYGTADGMKNAECNGGSQPAGWRGRDGKLWFPTQGGVAMIDPERMPEANVLPPPVMIEGALVDGRPVRLDVPARAPPGRGDLELRYTALSFVNPAKIKFKYRLEGFDKGWVEAGSRRTAFYTKVPPGDYRFRVVACNDAGVWNEAGAALLLVLRPHFYQTPVFRAGVVLGAAALFAAMGWGANRIRVERLRREAAILAERTRIAREIHDTVAQGLTGIALQLETAESILAARPDAARVSVARARDLVFQSLDETCRAIHALRPQPLAYSSLPEALRALGASMTAGAGIQLDVQVRGRPRPLPAAEEDDLWRIAQEALTNAIRHGKGDHVRIAVDYGKSRLRLSVADDGVGLTMPEHEGAGSGPERRTSGFGLRGMHERARARQWHMEVDSFPGRGTEVTVEVPLPSRLRKLLGLA